MNKKLRVLILSLMLMVSLLGYNVYADGIKLSSNEIYVTKAEEIDVTAEFDSPVNINNLKWSLGGKDLSMWKSFNMDTAEYDKEPWLVIKDVKQDGNIVKAKLEVKLPYGVDDTENRPYPRWTFENLLGEYELKAFDGDNSSSTKLVINNYKGFHTYEQLKPAIDEIIKKGNAKEGRYFEYQKMGESVEGRAMHLVLVSTSRSAIDEYLNTTLKNSHENPKAVIERINNGTIGNYKVPIFINNIHPDESPGVDSQIKMLEDLATKDEFKFKNKSGNEITLKVDDILNNFILIFDPTQNPDGKEHNKRENANGLDINRDNIYQTQVETQVLSNVLSTYDPLIFLDLHGFVKEFLIEPCTPPHEPNFEYDLLMGGTREKFSRNGVNPPGAVGNAIEMGDIAIANTKYNSFIVPMFDYGDGWDDGFLGYTGVFALIHGSLGHTVEVPEQNEQGMLAHYYTILGSINYAMNNKDTLYKNQLEIFRRNLENEDNKSVDTWHIDTDGTQIGRPRENGKSFFPDYYILPIDEKLQKNSLEVYNIVELFLRNHAKVYTSTQDVTYDGVNYPKGSIVIPLNQIKRSFVNAGLYTGRDDSNWGAMYAELVLNFPKMRGFDSIEVRNKGLFDGKLNEITTKLNKPQTSLNLKTDDILIKNSNNDATILVNRLLKNGKDVNMVVEGSKGINVGDYVVKKSDISKEIEGLYVKLENLNDTIKTTKLEEAKIYIPKPSSNYAELTHSTKFVLKKLEFNLVDKISDANTIVDSSGEITKEEIGKKNYIAIGSQALLQVKEKNIYPINIKMNEDGNGNEGLFNAVYDKTSTITGVYDKEDITYIASGSVIVNPSRSAKVFAKISDSKDYYIQGWWPKHEFTRSQAVGISDKVNDNRYTFFAADVTNKAHTAHLFRQLSNAIYAINSDAFMVGEGVEAKYGFNDLANHWAEQEIIDLAKKNIINGYANGDFKPENKITRSEFVKIVTSAFNVENNNLEIPFKDVKGHWAEEYIAKAFGKNIINGYSKDEFGVNKNITREEAAKIISIVLELKDTEEDKFIDKNEISNWALEHIDKTAKAKIINGYPNGEFKPKNNITRAESAVLIKKAMEFNK